MRVKRWTVALVLVVASAALSARALQRADPTFTPSNDGPTIAKSLLPVYPAIAQSARVQGTVIVDFAVDASGRVTDARISKGVDLLNNAASDAVRQWQFAPAAAPTLMRATATFRLNNPSLYPRPSRFMQPHPSWVSDNFAFVYKYQCRRASVEIDSIDHVVRNIRLTDKGPRTNEFAVSFEGDVVADAFTALDRTNLFQTSHDGVRAWKEVPRVASGFQQRGNELFVTVVADIPRVDIQSVSQVQFFGGPGSSRWFSHVLAVRQGDQWREVTWSEPVEKRDDRTRGFSAAGKRIRALVRDALVPAAAAPVCL